MTVRHPCPEAPGALEAYAQRFDDGFGTLAQRRAFRAYLQGLLLPRDRNKTLTALAETEPVVGAQHPGRPAIAVLPVGGHLGRAALNARLAGLLADPATRPHADGVLVVDDTGDRKDGTKTAHVARQYLGVLGKVDNGIVAVTSLWADERVYYPLHVEPYTPAPRLPKGKHDPAFRTKPRIAVELVARAAPACPSGRRWPTASTATTTRSRGVAPGPSALRARPQALEGAWVREGAARHAGGGRPAPAVGGADPLRGAFGRLARVVRRYRDGHREVWWATEPRFAGCQPEGPVRLVVATTDPTTLPHLDHLVPGDEPATPGRRARRAAPFAPADLAPSCACTASGTGSSKATSRSSAKNGWGDFQVRTDRAIRHWALVGCAFSFCWRVWFTTLEATWPARPPATRGATEPPRHPGGRGKRRGRPRGAPTGDAAAPPPGSALLAGRAPPSAQLARALDQSVAHLARLGQVHPAPNSSEPRPPRRRLLSAPLSPSLTKYR